nr:hypothetical protein [uncultured Mediterranean phage uvMED]
MSEIKVDTVAEKTSANGVTVDGLNIKDSKLVTSNSVVAGNITADAIDGTKIADNAIDSEHYTDASIDAAHLNADVITGATALTAEPADTDEFLISDAGTLKRIDYSLIKGGVDGITSSANASAMTIDSNEIISKTSQPMCFVCVGNTTGVKVQVNSAGSHTVLFSHERFDVGGNYNTSNGNFTVPVAGYYSCHASVRTFNTQQSAGYIQFRIQGNNQSCNEVVHLIASGNSATANNSFVGYFDANDTITCAIYNSADDDYQYGEGGNYNDTHMSIYKVG